MSNNENNYCENYFNDNNISIYVLTIDISDSTNQKNIKVYDLFYSQNNFNNSIFDICFNKNEIINCSTYSIESIINNSCLTCKNNYYPIYDNSSLNNNGFNSNNSYIKCYNSLEGYYLDNNKYKPCYHLCKKCKQEGNEFNHNCEECKEGYNTLLNGNCINPDTTIINSYFSDNSDEITQNIINSESESMITDYDTSEYTLNPQKNISIDECFKLGFYEFNNSCYENCPEGTMISKIKKYHCDKICPKERLYEDMITKECISNCSINDMFNQICKISHTNETDKIEERKNLSKFKFKNNRRNIRG